MEINVEIKWKEEKKISLLKIISQPNNLTLTFKNEKNLIIVRYVTVTWHAELFYPIPEALRELKVQVYCRTAPIYKTHLITSNVIRYKSIKSSLSWIRRGVKIASKKYTHGFTKLN